ncbi:MAG: hypothetical protein KatS3mg065_1107 [Chloroflexota bacterium]|nr:MAG: hypothetical protein KatS3mg065_1107 [Chloroflexota bacterium]
MRLPLAVSRFPLADVAGEGGEAGDGGRIAGGGFELGPARELDGGQDEGLGQGVVLLFAEEGVPLLPGPRVEGREPVLNGTLFRDVDAVGAHEAPDRLRHAEAASVDHRRGEVGQELLEAGGELGQGVATEEAAVAEVREEVERRRDDPEDRFVGEEDLAGVVLEEKILEVGDGPGRDLPVAVAPRVVEHDGRDEGIGVGVEGRAALGGGLVLGDEGVAGGEEGVFFVGAEVGAGAARHRRRFSVGPVGWPLR